MDEDKRTAEETDSQEEQPNNTLSEHDVSKPEQQQKAQKKKREISRSSKVLRSIMAGILTLLLIALAIIVFVFRDELTGESLRRTFGRENSVSPTREAFTYETGAEQVFAPAGDGLAVACSSSVQLLNAKGQTVFKQVVSFETPAVFACADRALFCDLGGTACISAGMNESVTIDSDDANRGILTASMNQNGWFAVVTTEPGYKGLVSVYDAACEKQYEWWSATGYILRAVLSPDNRMLAVLTVESEGTILRFFALNSETTRAEVTFEGTLVYDMSFLSTNTIRAVGDEGFYIVNQDGSIRGEYPFDGRYLLDYEFGSTSFTALYVSDYRGGGGTLLTLDDSGKILASQQVDRDVVSLSASGRQLLVLTGGGLVLYDSTLVRQYANETLMTARRAILRSSGDILLLSAYSAERFSF